MNKMDISEEKILHLNNKPAKFKGIIYPEPLQSHIQRPYYCCCSIGCRGSGKTYSVVKMLSNAEKSGFINPETGGKSAIRHILFSPTIEGNPIFKTLKYLDEEDMYNDYNEGKLLEILDELKEDRHYTKEYNEYVSAYKKFENMTESQFWKWKDKDAILLLMNREFIHYDFLDKPKYPHGCIVNIILDDVLSNKDAFSQKKSSVLNKAVLNGRHYGVNIIICAQNLKGITKCIRANTQIWILFPFKSMKIIMEDLFPEFSGTVNEEEFLNLYNLGTNDEHDALVIDEKDERGVMFKKNFDVILCRGKK